MPVREKIKRGTKIAASKFPEILLAYYVFRQGRRASAKKADSYATLSNRKAITLKSQPNASNIGMYLDTVTSKISEAADYTNPTVKAFANDLAGKYEGKYNISQVCAIFEHLFNNWRYVSDNARFDTFERASESIISNLSGDCDSFAVLMSAVILSIGGNSRINVAFNDKGGHAFAEVLIGKNKTQAEANINKLRTEWTWHDPFEAFTTWVRQKGYELNYTQDQDSSCWLNLDWWSGHPGGKYFPSTFRVAIHPVKKTHTVITDEAGLTGA